MNKRPQVGSLAAGRHRAQTARLHNAARCGPAPTFKYEHRHVFILSRPGNDALASACLVCPLPLSCKSHQHPPAMAKADAVDQLALERALGCGSCSAGLCAAYHPASPNLLAYPSGGVVVLWDSARKQQLSFFRSKRACRPFASLAFSRDGAYLAAGERSTTQGAGPEIIIWECSTGRQLQALRGHKHGVGSVAFSHDGRLLVTTGESYDGQLCVWDWQAGVLLCKQHAQTEVYRACFVDEAAASTTIATIGKSGHFKVRPAPAALACT